jgi:hypothetical protein
LGERVAACWLNLYYVDALYARRLNNVTFAEGEYFQRRQERAHRLYLSAVRTLAQVQRLLVPAVQVNIGAQQLNVANVLREALRRFGWRKDSTAAGNTSETWFPAEDLPMARITLYCKHEG